MQLLQKLWAQSPPLTATSLLMIVAFLGSAVGMLVDPRMIAGFPAWLKPMKFAVSTGIFSITVAWIFGYLTPSKRLAQLGAALASSVILEVVIIDVQAFRGTTSHFNQTTVLNGALFSIMGLGILVLWLASAGVLMALWRQKFSDSAWGWALKVAMLITVIGSAAGGLMLRPTPGQNLQLRSHEKVTAIGGHTIGAPDGGPGLAGVGWSRDHGDLRIPHFLGLHAIQAVPFLAWLGRRSRKVLGFTLAMAASYFVLTAILMGQALGGESIVHPGRVVATLLGLWAVSTAASAMVTA